MAESRLIGNEKGNPTTDAATTWVDLSDITLTEGEPITEEHLLVTFTYNSRKNYSGDKPEGWGDWLRRQMLRAKVKTKVSGGASTVTRQPGSRGCALNHV